MSDKTEQASPSNSGNAESQEKNSATRRRRTGQNAQNKQGLTKASRDVIPNQVDANSTKSLTISEKTEIVDSGEVVRQTAARKQVQKGVKENSNAKDLSAAKQPDKVASGRTKKESNSDALNDALNKVKNPAPQALGSNPVFSAAPESSESERASTAPKQLAAASLLFQAPVFQAPTFLEAGADAETGRRKRNRNHNQDSDDFFDGSTTGLGEADGSSPDGRNKRSRMRRKDSASRDQAEDALDSDSQREPKNERNSNDKSEKNGQKNQRKSKRQDKNEYAGTDTEGIFETDNEDTESTTRRRRRRSRPSAGETETEVAALKGSTRLEAKRQRRKEERREGRRRPLITEAEFLARRESVDRQMVVREKNGLNQIAVLEDGLLVEHYVSRHTQTTMVGNIYLGKVQNVLPSMEAAFVDLGKGRNAVLYAGEVNWDATGQSGKTGRIEDALTSGDTVLVQVTKDPIGHKGARLTSQITLAGRHLVLVPSGGMTGISRKLLENERTRLKGILKEIIPSGYGVIVRTAAEGATEEQLRDDVQRLTNIWDEIQNKKNKAKSAPALLHGEPELALRVIRDIFNEDFKSLTVQGEESWKSISRYVKQLSPELSERLIHWRGEDDVFAAHRVDEQLAKGFERKVWLPSGGYLIIDRTEAMSVIDVNTGRYIGSGGSLEETVTKNNLEAAEEIVRQLRLRDIGGIVVIDFVDMVIESNRDLVLRRLIECLGRDRTRHQVTEVTSLGLVQMTRKRVGQGLVEAFSTTCECCNGRGFIVHDAPVERNGQAPEDVPAANKPGGRNNRNSNDGGRKRSGRGSKNYSSSEAERAANSETDNSAKNTAEQVEETKPEVRQAMSGIAKAAAQAHEQAQEQTGVQGNKQTTEEEKPARPRRRRAASTGVITA